MTAFRLSVLVLATFYLMGPLLMIWELFRPEISIPILLLFTLWVFAMARGAAALESPRASAPAALTMSLVVLILCIAWIYFSGIGGYASCRWDYIKHNLMFSYLLEQKLPIDTVLDGKKFILHYSLAYYLTPVRLTQALEKLLPRANLNLILLLIYSAALFIALRILAGGSAYFSLTLLLVLSLVGGWDVLGMIVFGVKPSMAATLPVLGIEVPGNLEWWGVPYAPQSLTANLYWAPQHFFAALIGTALVFAFMRSSRPLAAVSVDVLIVVAACVFWSPYVAVGLAVLALVKLGVDDRVALLRRLRQEGLAPLLTPWSLLACAFATLLALAAWVFLNAAEALSPPRLLIDQSNALSWLLTYTLNFAPLIVALILAWWCGALRAHSSEAIDNRGPSWQLVSTIAAYLAASAALLLISHGSFDDWAMRATLPLSVALALGVTQSLAKLKRGYLAVFLGVLALSSASSLSEFAQSLLKPTHCVPYGTFSLDDMGVLASQYEGRPDSMLYRHLVRSR